MAEESAPFDGLKVLDVGTWIAAPAAATILADFGASVLKVEAPGAGDPYRELYRMPLMPASEVNYGWVVDSRNKQSVTLNLKTPEGREILRKLVAGCDVYVTNQPLPMRRALGLCYEDLAPLNERMIYASLTAFGEAGPDADLEAFDAVAWWGRSGLMEFVRANGAPPTGMVAHGMGDHAAAVSLYAAIVTALLRRERSGKGGKVHTSLLANGLWSNAILAQAAMVGARFPDEAARRPPLVDLLLETADGQFVKPFLLRTHADVDRLLNAAGLAEATTDPRFAEPGARAANLEALVRLLRETFARRGAAEWLAALRAAGVAVTRVVRTEELPEDPQLEINGMVVPPADKAVPARRVVSHPLNVDGAARAGVRRSPELGEHTREVLAGLGYSAADIERLAGDGVI